MICPFCDQKEKSSSEHVFGQQFAEHFDSVKRHVEYWGDYADPWAHDRTVETPDGYATKRVPRGKQTPELHQVQVKVGENCNNGWMAKLDDAAVAVFQALTAHDQIRLPTSVEAAKISAWFVKMGLTYDLFQTPTEQAYTPALRHEFFAARALPGTTVYLGYAPTNLKWVSFWQRGWHVAPKKTPADQIVHAAPNLSTTFILFLGLRLVAHRVSPDLPHRQQRAANTWLRKQMRKTQMVPINTVSTQQQPSHNVDIHAVQRGQLALQEFVIKRSNSVAPLSD